MPFSSLRSARSSGSSPSGAFDLPSVLIGVAVVAILAIGVMATIFGVIPWAQDRAAKQDLAAMNTAQGTVYARDGSFTDKAALVAAGWLGEGTPAALDAKADAEGKCYVAVTTSKTGNQFVISHNKPTPRELTAAETWCNGSRIIKDGPVMITTWDTSLSASCSEITLPVTNLKGTVSWGDEAKDSATTHAFTSPGQVSIRIDGTFTAWGGQAWADAGCLVSVDRWGETGTTDLKYAFYSAHSLRHVESIPTTTTSLTFAFAATTADFSVGSLDTGNVTAMSNMFSDATAFNQSLSFDTSKVTSMSNMFYGAAAFNQPLSFDTSQVTSMNGMFYGAAAFNQPLSFDTSKVADMHSMFRGANAFDRPVNFNTAAVKDMSHMFREARAFNQPLNFNTANVTTMARMLENARAFNQPVGFNTSKVTNMSGMFRDAWRFDQSLRFDTSKVTNMSTMFSSAYIFNQDLSEWDVSAVIDRGQFDLNATAWLKSRPHFAVP